MFEDSTFESTGRIRTRSRGWMIAAFAFNGSILLALILIPLIYPEALPRMAMLYLMEAPPPPMQQPRPQPQIEHATVVRTQMPDGHLFAPRTIPKLIPADGGPEDLAPINIAAVGLEPGGSGAQGPLFPGASVHPMVRPETRGPVRLPSSMVAGMLIQKTMPIYPAIPKAVRLEGTVILQATISRAGTIENLRVMSGPPMFQQAALDAVKTWRYRPYLLNGEPVEVETTVNVVFTLGR
jgi:protein TonB